MRLVSDRGLEDERNPAHDDWLGEGRLSAIALLAGWAGIAVLCVMLVWNESLQASILDRIGMLAQRWHLANPEGMKAFVAGHSTRLLVLVISLVPVLLIETRVVGYRSSSIGRLASGRSISAVYDLAVFALVLCGLWTLLSAGLGFGMSRLMARMSHGVLAGIAGSDLRIRSGSLWGDLLLYFMALTFFDYWTHRLFHMKPLWYLHRMHHSASEMTVLTLWRSHPAAPAIESALRTWPLALFDMPVACTILITYFVVSYEYLIHSNIPWTWGWFGRWILIPPAGHRIHHSNDAAHFNANLGIIVLWDRLFGTWCGSGTGAEPVGVPGVPYNSGRFVEEIWRDLLTFVRALPRPYARAPGDSSRPV